MAAQHVSSVRRVVGMSSVRWVSRNAPFAGHVLVVRRGQQLMHGSVVPDDEPDRTAFGCPAKSQWIAMWNLGRFFFDALKSF